MYVYMAVTDDKYELPIAIEDSPLKLSKRLNVKINTIYASIYRNYKRSIAANMRFMKIEI